MSVYVRFYARACVCRVWSMSVCTHVVWCVCMSVCTHQRVYGGHGLQRDAEDALVVVDPLHAGQLHVGTQHRVAAGRPLHRHRQVELACRNERRNHRTDGRITKRRQEIGDQTAGHIAIETKIALSHFVAALKTGGAKSSSQAQNSTS